MGDLARNHIVPVATHYQSMLIKNVQGLLAIGRSGNAIKEKLIDEIEMRTDSLEELADKLDNARRIANHIEDIHQRAIAYHDTVCPVMDDIRTHADKLELIVEDGLWTLPKYRELLFIR